MSGTVTRMAYIRLNALTHINYQGRRVLVKVVKINRTKYVARDESGQQYTCAIPRTFIEAPEGTVFTEPEAPELQVHTHVRFKPGTRNAARVPDLLFIIGHGGALGTWKCAVVGTSRYYREVPASELVPVEVEIVG